MNEIKRYDQELAEQLGQISLPDENFAWAEMKKMLDEDDDDPVFIPFYRRFGCAVLGMVGLLLLLVGGWFYYQTTKKEDTIQATDLPGRTNTSGKAKTTTAIGMTPTGGNDSTTVSLRNSVPADTDPAPVQPAQQSEALNDASITRLASNTKTSMKVRAPGPDDGSTASTGGRKNDSRPVGGKTTANIRPGSATNEETVSTDETARENSSSNDTAGNNTTLQIPAVDTAISPSKKNSALTVKTDAPVINKKKEAIPSPKKEQKTNSWLLGAGLSVYQPFSLNGEPAVPYNRYGRKGSLSDYLPSAYFRVYRNKKWFIHTEFRYGAPQAVKPFNYKQEIMIDSFQSVLRSVYQLKKTYYHQVPLSFHYYVLPGLTLGTGVIYNRFGGAIANQDVFRGNNGAVDTLISSAIVSDPDKNRFVKNHFQWSAEAQYQWKRISIGARYSKDINPYIQYTDILTGTSVEKKAAAFNVFLRYELWKKRLK